MVLAGILAKTSLVHKTEAQERFFRQVILEATMLPFLPNAPLFSSSSVLEVDQKR